MNKESYVLRLEGRTLSPYAKYKFGSDIKEIYDFKLQNREKRIGEAVTGYDNPYPFMALVKKDNYLQLIGSDYNFDSSQQSYDKNMTLLPIKQYTQAYFNNFHFNNSFFLLYL